MTGQPLFAERHGYTQGQDKKIIYQTELPNQLRHPIVDLIKRYGLNDGFLWGRIKAVFDPYGLSPLPSLEPTEAIVLALSSISQKASSNSMLVKQFTAYDRMQTSQI